MTTTTHEPIVGERVTHDFKLRYIGDPRDAKLALRYLLRLAEKWGFRILRADGGRVENHT